MSDFEFILTGLIIGLVFLTTDYRKNALIVAAEFAVCLLATYLLINLEFYTWVGACWVFGARALILYAAMRATVSISGHRMIFAIMLLGMLINVGTYFEYALKSYWLFDAYYTPAARAVMILQLIYLIGIGYVGTYVGRIRVAGVRWWRSYRLHPERRRIAGGIE